ncbi:DMT family transporter [Xanthobacter sp. TB0139]|uniref:DMT family transporter n=1 Tax=Xanthobacter sp. TB0139 TaxID=3459178 RepID=UPI00403A3259
MNRTARGWLNGFIGMVIFSGSLPATRVGVSGLDPFFLTGVRAVIAALLSIAMLVVMRQPLPRRRDILSLVVVVSGLVVGFPLFTGLALQEISSAQSLVFIGLLPLVTALFGVLRGGERPRPAFWLFSGFGSALVVAYAAAQGLTAAPMANVMMLLAIVTCGLSYAEGGRLARHLGGWQVICWALVVALPVMVPLSLFTMPGDFAAVPARAWVGLGYVALFSMLIGCVFWYRGLAQGGIAAVGQLQLLQPFFGLALAALLLHEEVRPEMLMTTLGVALCVAAASRFSAKVPAAEPVEEPAVEAQS